MRRRLIVGVSKDQVSGVYPDLLRELGSRIGCNFVFQPVPRARQEMLFMARRSNHFMPAQRTDRPDYLGQRVALLQARPVLMAWKPLPPDAGFGRSPGGKRGVAHPIAAASAKTSQRIS